MIFTFRPLFRSCIFLFLVPAIFTNAGKARSAAGRAARPTAISVERSAATDGLAEEIKEIANSHAISRAKKEKRISTAVRVAVIAATAYQDTANEILGIALELTQSAAAAAPSFAEVIAKAVSFTPSLARIDSAPGQIRTAAFAAARAPGNSRRASVRKKQPLPPIAAYDEMPPPDRDMNDSVSVEPPTHSADDRGEYPAPRRSSGTSKFTREGNSNFSVSADVSVRHDDNVYLNSSNKTGDTIIAVTPGVEFHFGQNSLAHGSVSYKNALTRYTGKTAPDVALSSGAADFGYDSGTVTITSNAAYQQLDQNNADVAALGQKSIIRQNVLSANAGVEAHVTAKTSVKTGVNYSKTDYKSGGLIGSQQTELPFKVYYETTPKVSLSTGFAYRRVTPQNGGPSGRDLDYNIGARGAFTAKLNGEFSLDYRTRTVGNNPRENLWGFNGALNYEITPKTTSSLVFSRDFNTGALGESLKNSNYSFRVSTDLTPQWQVGTGVSYRQVEYGATVFRVNNHPMLIERTDNYWEGDVQISYLYRSWLTASADYTVRHNQSNLNAAQFSNSIISLILGWRY